MPWSPDPDTAVWILWIAAGFFFLVFLISAIGEVLGWWALVGELGMGIGASASLLLSLAALVYGASRDQVGEVSEEVQGLQTDLRMVGSEVRRVGDTVFENGETLDSIHDGVSGEDGLVEELDVVQVELERQTGVLDRQARILTQIRDRL